jgi:hypothetical protein
MSNCWRWTLFTLHIFLEVGKTQDLPSKIWQTEHLGLVWAQRQCWSVAVGNRHHLVLHACKISLGEIFYTAIQTRPLTTEGWEIAKSTRGIERNKRKWGRKTRERQSAAMVALAHPHRLLFLASARLHTRLPPVSAPQPHTPRTGRALGGITTIRLRLASWIWFVTRY